MVKPSTKTETIKLGAAHCASAVQDKPRQDICHEGEGKRIPSPRPNDSTKPVGNERVCLHGWPGTGQQAYIHNSRQEVQAPLRRGVPAIRFETNVLHAGPMPPSSPLPTRGPSVSRSHSVRISHSVATPPFASSRTGLTHRYWAPSFDPNPFHRP